MKKSETVALTEWHIFIRSDETSKLFQVKSGNVDRGDVAKQQVHAAGGAAVAVSIS